MARILLGVSGGIAAYKSLELARLATGAGHGVRVADDRGVGALRRGRLLRGHRRRARPHLGVRARPAARRLPGDPLPEHDPIGHLALAANCDVYLVAPASANTIAKLAAGDGRLDADHRLPRLRRAPPGRPGDERPHVRRRGDPGEPGDAARARRRGDRARRGPAGLAGRVRPRAAARAGRPAGAGRSGAARRASAPGTACGCWSPPAARGSRWTRSASSATAPAAGWVSRSPPPPPVAGPR